MLTATYDVATKVMTIDPSGAQPWGADIAARLNRYGQTIEFSALSFGLKVTVDGAAVCDKSWPPPKQKLARTDQDTLHVERVLWRSEQAIVVTVWFENAGARIEATKKFTAPRPAQPYASWKWIAGRWTPPVAYPSGDGEYEWDEASLAWVAA